jgi:hypothetical protein
MPRSISDFSLALVTSSALVSGRRVLADGIGPIADFTSRAGTSNPLALVQEIDLIVEGTLVTQRLAPETDICTVARRAAETLMEKYLRTAVRRKLLPRTGVRSANPTVVFAIYSSIAGTTSTWWLIIFHWPSFF